MLYLLPKLCLSKNDTPSGSVLLSIKAVSVCCQELRYLTSRLRARTSKNLLHQAIYPDDTKCGETHRNSEVTRRLAVDVEFGNAQNMAGGYRLSLLRISS